MKSFKKKINIIIITLNSLYVKYLSTNLLFFISNLIVLRLYFILFEFNIFINIFLILALFIISLNNKIKERFNKAHLILWVESKVFNYFILNIFRVEYYFYYFPSVMLLPLIFIFTVTFKLINSIDLNIIELFFIHLFLFLYVIKIYYQNFFLTKKLQMDLVKKNCSTVDIKKTILGTQLYFISWSIIQNQAVKKINKNLIYKIKRPIKRNMFSGVRVAASENPRLFGVFTGLVSAFAGANLESQRRNELALQNAQSLNLSGKNISEKVSIVSQEIDSCSNILFYKTSKLLEESKSLQAKREIVLDYNTKINGLNLRISSRNSNDILSTNDFNSARNIQLSVGEGNFLKSIGYSPNDHAHQGYILNKDCQLKPDLLPFLKYMAEPNDNLITISNKNLWDGGSSDLKDVQTNFIETSFEILEKFI